ncbi:MAG: hypothetical protein JNM69_23315 [Archangium sp.]|nr:hypothetical protein [Archangium sp.]
MLFHEEGRVVAQTPSGVISMAGDGAVRAADGSTTEGGGARTLDDSAAAAWCSALGGVITFGDDDGSSTDTWVFKAGSWKKLKVPKRPIGRTGAFAFESPDGVVLVGGTSSKGKPLHEHWRFDGKTWIGPEKLSGLSDEALQTMGFDGARLVAVEVDRFTPDAPLEVRVLALAGKKWVPLMQVPIRSSGVVGAAIDATTREVVLVGALNGAFQISTLPLPAVAAPSKSESRAPKKTSKRPARTRRPT